MPGYYPEALDTLRAWATANGVLVSEARVRFAQYGVLRSIASSRELGALLVFKGGNALDFIWEANRSTRDLDFSVDMSVSSITFSADRLASLLVPALDVTARVLGIAYRLHKIEQQPPGEGKTFITYEARIGYALPDEIRLRERLTAGSPSPNVVPLEISLNEPKIGAIQAFSA